MLRPTHPNTPSPVADEDVIVAPEGPVNRLKDTDTLPAAPDPASRMTLKATTSLRPPKMEILLPSQAEFFTLAPRVALKSSRVTLSSPVLAQIAVMPWAAKTGTSGSIRQHTIRQRIQDVSALNFIVSHLRI